jgi:Arc/MetJ-type ribon-helix-helix transcriptional regulator
MKQKVSITLDEETLKLIEESLKSRAFRNRSHVIEFSVNEILNGKEKGEEK